MRNLLKMTVLIAGLGLGAAVHADDDCNVPVADWQPKEAVLKMAADQGWTVRRVKVDDGCYEIEGSDKAGRDMEVTVNPGTLKILEIDYEDDGRTL